MKKILILILFQTLHITSFADNKIPDKLFGITLGEIYKTNNKDMPILPVQKITGCMEIFGHGMHCYFKPIEGAVSKKFPYVEKKKNSKDEFYETSFHVYVLPIIPSNIDSIEELEKLDHINVEIIMIDWSDFPKEDNNKTKEDIKKDCYYWAFDLCKTFEAHFSIKPKIEDNYENKIYICKFASDERELIVTGMGFKHLELTYNRNVTNKKNDFIDITLRKLAAKKILP